MHAINKPSKYSQEYLHKLFQYTLGEDIANAITHCVGAFFALAALVSLTWVSAKYGNWQDSLAFISYGFSILFMFLMSTLYHSMVHHTARSVFKRLDHIAIYILIVGSYTPYVFSLLKTEESYLIYGILFITMLIGIIYKSLIVTKSKKISTLFYVLMGWLSLFILPQILAKLNLWGLIFLISGGVFYTGGAILYAFAKFKYSHMIWHLFVLSGAVSIWISINFYILQYR